MSRVYLNVKLAFLEWKSVDALIYIPCFECITCILQIFPCDSVFVRVALLMMHSVRHFQARFTGHSSLFL